MKVAIVGATGLVGTTFLKVLEERDLGITDLYLFASARSAGKKINFRGQEYTVEELTETSFDLEYRYSTYSQQEEISVENMLQ